MESQDFVAYGRLPWYPHMAVADAAIWERYLAYDVAVGAGAEFDATAGGLMGPGINKIYQRKIDVVAVKLTTLFLIELKPRATTAAIGQLQGYATLFKRDYASYGEPRLRIITDSLMPEMQFLADQAHIEIVVV